MGAGALGAGAEEQGKAARGGEGYGACDASARGGGGAPAAVASKLDEAREQLKVSAVELALCVKPTRGHWMSCAALDVWNCIGCLDWISALKSKI